MSRTNEELLILYLERLLGGLLGEIYKADEALGPDVDRVEIKRFKPSEEAVAFSSAMDAMRMRHPPVEIQETEPVIGIANALEGLEGFALSLKDDIDDLRGEK